MSVKQSKGFICLKLSHVFFGFTVITIKIFLLNNNYTNFSYKFEMKQYTENVNTYTCWDTITNHCHPVVHL